MAMKGHKLLALCNHHKMSTLFFCCCFALNISFGNFKRKKPNIKKYFQLNKPWTALKLIEDILFFY